MTVCDICGKHDVHLVDLLDCYQTHSIKQVCHPCEKSVNEHLNKLRALAQGMTATWLQNFMGNLRERSQPK